MSPTGRLIQRALADPSVWARAAKLGLSVGLVQAALNQGDHWFNHRVDAIVVLKTVLSPLITFSVALCSSVATRVESLKSTRTNTTL